MKKNNRKVSVGKGIEARTTGFCRIASLAIDNFDSGEKIDRRALAKQVNETDGIALSDSDAESLVGIILRSRDDIETIKGKEGGTFKK
jgi:hypothetical protein